MTNPLKRLDSLDSMRDKATPGVWKIWGMEVMADQKGTSNVDDAVPVAQTYCRNADGSPRTFDAQFIIEAHREVPVLTSAIRAALRKCDQLEKLADDRGADEFDYAVKAASREMRRTILESLEDG